MMFESQQAFDHIDAILSMPGIDAVTLARPTWPRNSDGLAPPDQGKGD